MKTLFYALALCMFATIAKAQWLNITNLNGTTAHYGIAGCETDVSVTGTGAFSNASPALYCGIGPYWIGIGGGSSLPTLAPGGYTYTFSNPVRRIRISATHSHLNEIIHIKINGINYPLSSGNLSASTLSGSCTSGTWPSGYTITPGGDLKSTTSGSMGASAVITINDKCIGTLEISTNGYYNGTLYSLDLEPHGNSIAGTITGPSSYCGSGTGTYHGSGFTIGCGAIETWSSSHPSILNFPSPSSGSAIVSNVCPSTEVVITHSFSDVCGTVNATTAVTVNPTPVFSLTYSPNPLCSEQTYTTTIVPVLCPGETYTSVSWSGSGTGSSLSESRPGVYATDPVSLIYHASVINNYGCPATGALIVNVQSQPVISPIPATVCLGDTRTFNVQASASGGTWSSFNPTIASVVTSGLTTGDVTGNALGSTTITYTSPFGCIGTTSVTVMPPPSATLTASPTTLCAPGGTSLLSATISYTGGGTLHYWWDDPTIGGGMSFPGSTYLAPVTSTTTYNFTVTDGFCSSTVPITVTVQPLPMATATYIGCNPPCPSTTLTYLVHGDPYAIVYYSWTSPCGATGTGSTTLDGAGYGPISVVPGGSCEGLFHLSITKIISGDCINNDGYSLQPLYLSWPTAMFCTEPKKKCCGWIDFTICGTPSSIAYIEPFHIPVSIDAYGIGSLHIWLCETTTLTIGDVVGPCCTGYSGASYTYTPLSASAAPTVECHVAQIEGIWTYWFDVSGIGASDPFVINFTENLVIIGGTGPCTAGPNPGSVSGTGPGTYYVSLPALPCVIISISGVTISADDCTWEIPCTPTASKPGRNDDENALTVATGNISVNPNPNSGFFTINGSLVSAKTSKEATIEITDLIGRVIYTTVASINEGVINKEVKIGSEIVNGVYMISIKNAEVNEVIKMTIDR